MKLFGRELSSEVAVVAEIGVNHEGDVDAAVRLIEAAAKAGSDAVKFQSYTPERFIGSSDAARLARASKFALSEAAHRKLAKVAKDLGISFFSAAITEDWVPLIAELGAAIKIASGDLTFEPVISAAAKTGKPIIISTGAGSVAEIDKAVEWVRAVVGEILAERLVLLHCVSLYPASVSQANLRSIPFLAERYRVPVGWSNHVIGQEVCLSAVAVGAKVIEVHLTDQKDGRSFRDHQLSFEPQELAQMITSIRDVQASLGSFDKAPQPEEMEIRHTMRKGVVAACDIAQGTRLEERHLSYARPATEFSASELPMLLEATTSRAFKAGEPIERTAVHLKK